MTRDPNAGQTAESAADATAPESASLLKTASVVGARAFLDGEAGRKEGNEE